MAPPRFCTPIMTKHTPIDRWVRRLGFLAGLLIAAGAILGWRMPPSDGRVGLDLSVVASAPRPLEVSPAGPILRARGMAATGRPRTATGTLKVANTGQGALRLRVRGLASERGLDRKLVFAISASGIPLFRGTQGQLRRWTRRSLLLPAGTRRELTVSSSLAPTGAQAAPDSVMDVSLEIQGRPDVDVDCVDQPSSGTAQPRPWIPRPPLPPCVSPS